jgi:tripeptide aminopeptidase
MPDSLLTRFLRYVRVDTQSREGSGLTPSTPNQWVLLRMLERELRALGARQVRITEHGYVMATIPATSRKKNVPTVAFLAHVDTAPEYPGREVKPLVHRKWNGRPIRLPDDAAQVLDPAGDAMLRAAQGKDLVTASGKTLLGADDKAGVAIVMTLAHYLLEHREIPHGPIRVCFNPDEEVGRGVERLSLDELGANVAYTLDGGEPGEVAWETFSADKAEITIEGVSTHPGEAKKYGMVSALRLAAQLLAALPRDEMTPDTTDKREGFIHPYRVLGGVGRAEIYFILRDFELKGLKDKGQRLKRLVRALQRAEPRAKIACQITPQYRNMAYWLKKNTRPVDLAYDACREVGLRPFSPPTRGGTDGSRLTERGLPTPNLFDGAHNLHGPLEWVAVQDMELAVKTCTALARLWEQKGDGFKGYRPKARRKPARK